MISAMSYDWEFQIKIPEEPWGPLCDFGPVTIFQDNLPQNKLIRL